MVKCVYYLNSKLTLLYTVYVNCKEVNTKTYVLYTTQQLHALPACGVPSRSDLTQWWALTKDTSDVSAGRYVII